MSAGRKSDLTAEAPNGASAEVRPLPDVPIWKRAQRAVELMRDYALLFESARTDRQGDRRPLASSARAIGEQLAAELASMNGLLETIASAQPVPKAPPRSAWWNKEDGE